MTHLLKTWPEYYQLIVDGVKRFELRKADRDFNEGDMIVLQEFDPLTFKHSGRQYQFIAGYILHGPVFGLEKGYCIISLHEPPKQ